MSTPRSFLPAAGLLLLAALSAPAADRILVGHLAPDRASLFISNADGSAESPLAPSSSLDYNPSWSPKGDWVVFTSERSGSADLYRVHPSGAGLERLTDSPSFDDQAAFSPDQSQIVFVSTRAARRANLWILDLATRAARPLTSGAGGDFRPAWSPDGQWIAFSSDRGSTLPSAKARWERLHLVDTYVVHPDGSGLRRLTAHGNFCGSPKWTSGSAAVLAYCMSAQNTWDYRIPELSDGDTAITRIPLDGGAPSPLLAPPGIKVLPSPLPSGVFGFLRVDKSVHGIFYSDGRHGPTGDGLRFPSWSPDGQRLVYARVARLTPPDPTPLPSLDDRYTLLAAKPEGMTAAYSPDGSRYAGLVHGPNDMALLRVGEPGKAPVTILERKQLMLGPQWSPDSRRIAFGIGLFTAFLDFDAGVKHPVTRVNGGAQVAIVNADGSDFHLVTSGPNNNAFPAFSPDGKRLVYRTAGPDGDGLRVLTLADQSITTLTGAYDNFPRWSPRGDSIAFVRKIGDNFLIFTVHPDGSGLRQLTDCNCNDAHLAWSPDGARIAFTSSRAGFKDEAPLTGNPQPYGDIFVMNSDGSGLVQLTDNQWEDGTPAWRPAAPSTRAHR